MIQKHNARCTSKKERENNVVLIACLFVISMLFIDCRDAPAAEPGGYSLVGTIMGSEFVGAVIKDSSGSQSFYRLYDKLPDGSKVVLVRTNSISLKGTDGTTYEMYILHETKTAVVSVKSDVPADPYAQGALRNIDAEPPNSHVRHRGRAARQRSETE